MRFEGFGLSLVDAARTQLLYAALDNLEVRVAPAVIGTLASLINSPTVVLIHQ